MIVAHRAFTFASLVIVVVSLAVDEIAAHKPITSKHTYNTDVFPIFRDKCSQCHVAGGVAPMSLMTYEDAVPWAESIRAELIAGDMPPATADDEFGAVKRAHKLSGTETDVILDWATGGAPRGSLDQKLPAITLERDWPLGAPDLILPLPAAFTIGAGMAEVTQEFTFATGITEPRWLRAIDLLPGTPSIVRSALVYFKAAGADNRTNDDRTGPPPDRVLARWLPGNDPEPLGGGVALHLPAGAQIVARIHYKKTWQFEGQPMSDRSTVGIYYATSRNNNSLLAVPVTSPPVTLREGQRLTFSHTLEDDVEVLAVEPEQVPANVTLQVEAVRPDGSHLRLVRFSVKSDWSRRYWLDQPPRLPRGTKIDVTVTPDDSTLMAAVFGIPMPVLRPEPVPIRIAVDVCSCM
jgi:hypothetical protein